MQSGIRTLALALWAPALAGILATTVTWLVWYYTAMPCTPENAAELMCRPGPMARYVSATVLNHCIIHAGIAITVTGGSDIMLFLRERKRNEEERQRNDQMMELVKSALEQAAEERRQADAERHQAEERAAEERRLADERAAEERHQAEERAAEERRLADERAAEERRQATLERQAFLDALNKLTEAISQNGHHRD